MPKAGFWRGLRRTTSCRWIGEVRSIETARFGEKILIKHLPNFPFLMDADMARRFHKRFAAEEELWRYR